MHRFWETSIVPVLRALGPENIVEIGSDQGLNTINLLAFCGEHGCKLHAIDPLPKYDAEEWQRQYSESLVFYQDLSLNALPRVGRFDAVLIDGDHNWYTVLNELRLIERCNGRQARPFPLVMIHDVGWPYARRDLYYEPENIPLAYRKPYRQKGMSLDSGGLLEEGGYNEHLDNAIYENELQNGVLTAIEDFLSESAQNIDFLQLPGFHGLGILVSRALRAANEELDETLGLLEVPSLAADHLRNVERARLELDICSKDNELIVQNPESEGGGEEDDESEASSPGYEEEIDDLRRVHREEIEGLKAAHEEELESERTEGRKEIERLSAESEELELRLDSKACALQAKQKEIQELHHRLALAEKRTRAADGREESRRREVTLLSEWIRKLEAAVTALFASRRWKTGNALGELLRKALLRSEVPMVRDHIEEIISEFHSWEEGHSGEIDLKTTEQPPQPLPSAGTSRPGRKTEPERLRPAPVAGGSVNGYITSSTGAHASVDVVICVHNALEDVKACLRSVLENTQRRFTLYIVNDGSDESTTGYLRTFCRLHPRSTLIEAPEAEGYTRAANRGLRASTADYVVLLNSDTIVPRGWLNKFVECGESDSRVGIVGPLSNAATWQSVPRIHENGGWAVNQLPEGYSVNDMAGLVSSVSGRRFPKLPFVNGFCFMVKRSLIDAIGYLDEETFPHGYGEENDYCLRAAEAGFELAVADHLYVYHAKSRSYSHERRNRLSKASGAALKQKHGERRISRNLEAIGSDPALSEVRSRLQAEIEALPVKDSSNGSFPFRVLFLLPSRGGGGGVHSVVQEVSGMREIGVFAQVATPARHRERYLAQYPDMDKELFYFFESEAALISYAGNFDVVVATTFQSVALLSQIFETNPEIQPAYYIQDYEPWFVETGSELERQAQNSYTAVPGTLNLAKTNWLRETISGLHGVEVEKVSPSLDHSVYYPLFGLRGSRKVKVTAMIRPKTPRRAPEQTMRVLRVVKEKHGDDVSVIVFGCEQDDPGFQALTRDFEFENRGVLIREEVADLLRETDVFLDFSEYQAFGRTGLEAMACGSAAVLPGGCGTSEYARHRENAMLVNTGNFDEMVAAVAELVEDGSLRKQVAGRGIETAASYSIRRAVLSELSIFYSALQSKNELVADTPSHEVETIRW